MMKRTTKSWVPLVVTLVLTAAAVTPKDISSRNTDHSAEPAGIEGTVAVKQGSRKYHNPAIPLPAAEDRASDQKLQSHAGSMPKSPLQGGEDIASAVAVAGLPATVTGTTAGYINDYDEICPYEGSTAPDVVYSYQPTENEVVNLSLCGSDYDTKIYIYEDSYTPGSPYACNDDACPGYRSYLWRVELTGGNTYYIIIDGYGTEAGAYELVVETESPCALTCPGQAIQEAEPTGCDSPDVTNGGCNSEPAVFSEIGCQETICGTAGTFEEGDSRYRDTDWYELVLTVPRSVTWTVTAEFPVSMGIVSSTSPGSGDCEAVTGVSPYDWVEACEVAEVSAELEPGTWWFFVAPSLGLTDLVPCDAKYYATLDCGCSDGDVDYVCDDLDNCPGDYNPGQIDGDEDGLGDVCDPVTIGFTTDVTQGEPPLTVAFTDLSSGINTLTDWHWDFGDQSTSEERNPVHTYTYGGFFDVTVIVSDGFDADTLLMDNLITTTNLSFNIVQLFGAGVWQIRSADLNRDNYIDFVWTPLVGNVKTSYGDGAGGLGTPIPRTVGTDGSLGAVAVGFLNTDSLPDIIVRDISSLLVLVNNGNNGYNLSKYPLSMPVEVAAVTLGYFNEDPFLDVLTDEGSYVGNGTGALFAGLTAPTNFAADVADFNEDGHDDLVTAFWDEVSIYVNDGFGNFTKTAFVTTPARTYDASSAGGLADFDHDGHVDFASVSYPIENPENRVSYITVVFGDGMGGIDRSILISTEGFAHNVMVADVDRDRELDLVVSVTQYDELEIFLGDGTGQFFGPVSIPWEAPPEITYVPLALAEADIDRDGNPDFVTGDLSSGGTSPLLVAYNQLPDITLLTTDEMRTVGFSDISVEVTNPQGFVVSKAIQTVAGSDYFRFDSDGDNILDQEAVDYNLQEGTYIVVGTQPPGAGPDNPWNMGIGIDGTQMALFANGYIWPGGGSKGHTNGESDTLKFYYDVEAVSSIQPPFGLPSGMARPVFDWSGKTAGDPPSAVYQLQLHRYHDFSFPPFTIDVAGLDAPTYTTPFDLPNDSILYWRFLTSYDGGTSYTDTSHAFALVSSYVPGCCLGVVGDANCEGGDIPTVSDISAIIDFLFITGTPLCCLAEADANLSGTNDDPPLGNEDITVSDISTLIDNLFITGTPLQACP